ncbi:spermidine/putrescine ABC transporter substrate-binding protein [soil metagenome]
METNEKVRTIKRWVASAAVLALALTACNPADTAEDDPAPAPDETTAVTGGDDTAAGQTCEPGETDGDLNFYNWSEYIDPDLITAFEDEMGVSVIESFFESNEAMLAQLQAGVVYDLVVPSDYMVGIMIEEGLLLRLDKDAIPNVSNLADQFSSPPYDPGLEYSVAYQYGTTGLGVNLAVVGADVEPSWALIFDPELASRYSGQISLLNDPRETMGAALMYLGYEINDTDLVHLQEATDLLATARQHVATFDSDQYAAALVNGEVAVSHGFSGGMITGISEADDPDQFVYLIPAEGATLWTDNMVIPVGSEHPCTAYAFIDFILDAENGAALTNWNWYGSPNAASAEFIDEEVADFYAGTEDAPDLQVIEDTGDYEINFTDYFAQARS